MSRRFHLTLGWINGLIGVLAAVFGFWWIAAGMSLLVAGQVIGYRNAER